jgi:hypothetical protein
MEQKVSRDVPNKITNNFKATGKELSTDLISNKTEYYRGKWLNHVTGTESFRIPKDTFK